MEAVLVLLRPFVSFSFVSRSFPQFFRHTFVGLFVFLSYISLAIVCAFLRLADRTPAAVVAWMSYEQIRLFPVNSLTVYRPDGRRCALTGSRRRVDVFRGLNPFR